MWFQLTITNNNGLLRNHTDGLVSLFKTEYYSYSKASGMEGVKEFTSNIILCTYYYILLLGLGGMTVLRYTRVFRITDGMIFNTIKNTDAFLSISVAPHNNTEQID